MTTDAPDDSFHVFDTTLRDGAQREGINLTVADKLTIARHLDEFGVGFIEGGWPGANPRDTEFFARARTEIDFRHAQLVAFGATRKAGVRAADDPQVKALLDVRAPRWSPWSPSPTTGTSSWRCAPRSKRTWRWSATPSRYLREQGRRVFVDCEHFFDGYRANAGYAKQVVSAAARGGRRRRRALRHQRRHAARADPGRRRGPSSPTPAPGWASTPRTTPAAPSPTPSPPWTRGATHVQCTANGYGERVGNANLFPVSPRWSSSTASRCCPTGALAEMTRISHAIAEVVNLAPSTHQPYVGVSAFAHKAGLHASAIKVDPDLYQHIDPELVGNTMRMLVSDMAGRASIELKGRELGYDLARRPGPGRPRRRPGQGAGAEGLHVRGRRRLVRTAARDEVQRPPAARFFRLESWRAIVEQRPDGDQANEATVKLWAKGERIVATGEGNGPVNALDRALRGGLERIYPQLASLSTRRLQGPHPGGRARHRRPPPGCWSPRATAARSGRRSVSRATSSPRPGRRWTTPTRTGCSGRRGAARVAPHAAGGTERVSALQPHRQDLHAVADEAGVRGQLVGETASSRSG